MKSSKKVHISRDRTQDLQVQPKIGCSLLRGPDLKANFARRPNELLFTRNTTSILRMVKISYWNKKITKAAKSIPHISDEGKGVY
jgi:hypothetical protein